MSLHELPSETPAVATPDPEMGRGSAAPGPLSTTGLAPRPLLEAVVRSPLEAASWRAFGAIVLGAIIAGIALSLVSGCFSAGGSVLIWLVGIPIIGLGIEIARVAARVERWRMGLVDPRPLVPHHYRPLPGPRRGPFGPWLRAWAEAVFLDANRWRDVIYVLVASPMATLELVLVVVLWAISLSLIVVPLASLALRSSGTIHLPPGVVPPEIPAGVAATIGVSGVLVGLALVPVAASASRGLMALHRAIVERLLCVDPSDALRADVARLRGSRAAAVELEASELRRIERDLHDGAQQRLVALAIDLGRAEDRLETDPAGARALIGAAREQARQALADLRDLVRGAAPAILLDRGLVAALGSVAAGCPIPTVVGGTLGAEERLPSGVERAAYFVVAEALANAAKHGEATRCEVTLDRRADRLVVEVRDDGRGGARLVPGGGLAGMQGRVEALDGEVDLSSPEGGPTVVHVELPLPGA